MSSLQAGTAAVDVAAAPPGLAHKAREAVAWTAGFTIFQDLLQFGVTLTLTRLLPPEAYGKFTLVNTMIGFFTVISYREILNHTLQVRSDADTHYQVHFTAGLFIQSALFLTTNLVALGMRLSPRYAPAAPYLHLMSLLLPLDLVCEFRVKMLERQLDWRRLRTLHAIGFGSGASLAVAMGLLGFGAWSLFVPALTMSLPFAWDLFVVERWRPTWEWDTAKYAPAWRFGIRRIGSGSLVSISSMAEGMLLTRAVGFTELGVYNRAIGLAALSCQRMASLFLGSVYPVLTRVPLRSDAYRRASALVVRTVTWVTIPLAAGLSITAEPTITLLYGVKWLAAAPLLPAALALTTLLAIVQSGYTLLLAHQRANRCLAADVMRLVGTLLALVFVTPYGLRAYLASLIALQLVIAVVTLAWLHADRAVSATGIAAGIGPSVASTCASLAIVLLVTRALGVPTGSVSSGLATGALFMGVYALTLRTCFSKPLYELLCQFPRRDQLLALLRYSPAA